MTGALDTAARNTASRLLAKFGKALTLTRATPGTYDIPSGKTTGDTTASYTVNGYVDGSSTRYLGLKYGPDLIKGGEIEITIPALNLAIVPTEGDQIAVGSQKFIVLKVGPTYSGELVATYALLVRAA